MSTLSRRLEEEEERVLFIGPPSVTLALGAFTEKEEGLLKANAVN